MKRYVQMVTGSMRSTVHIANSANSTYCQFEGTTRRKLIGWTELPAGARLCKNCVLLFEREHQKSPLAIQLDAEYRSIVGPVTGIS